MSLRHPGERNRNGKAGNELKVKITYYGTFICRLLMPVVCRYTDKGFLFHFWGKG